MRYALDTFKPNNKAFILNVKASQNTVLQIVHRSYAEQTRHEDDSFGFALQVTFPSHSKEVRAYEKFKASPLSSGFIPYQYEGTFCYVIDLSEDIVKAQELTERLLVEVYDFKDIQRLTVALSDEGEVANWKME
jgi:hypothetical protein